MEIKRKRKAVYYVTMNETKFEILSRFMRLIFNDLQELLRAYEDLELVITPDNKLQFRQAKVKFDFSNAEFLKLLLNIYHLAKQNNPSHNWMKEWENFKNELHLSQGRLSMVTDKKKLPRR